MWALEAVDRTLPTPAYPENVAKSCGIWDLDPGNKPSIERRLPTTIPCAALLPSVVDGLSSNQTVRLCCVGVTYYLHRTVLVNRIVVAIRAKAGEPEGNVGHLGVQLRAFSPL